MRTITEKQPWGYLICAGIKPIENRTWSTKVRGRVLIHTSKMQYKNPFDLLTNEQYDSISQDERIKANNSLEYGAIIGSVEIVDCVINHPSIWAEKSEGALVGNKFFQKEGEKPIYNWVLANPILFDKPILNVKGKLGFWEYDLKLD